VHADGHRRHDVLVIEDVPENREALEMFVTRGLLAVGAESGAQALDYFQAGMRPCVVFLDIGVPEIDGWHMWERTKPGSELSLTPVVILTGGDVDAERAKADGIREVLRKPVDGKVLVEALERHCNRKQP